MTLLATLTLRDFRCTDTNGKPARRLSTENSTQSLNPIRHLEDQTQALLQKNAELQRSAELELELDPDPDPEKDQVQEPADDLERAGQERAALTPENPQPTSEVRVHAGSRQLHRQEFRHRDRFNAYGVLVEVELVGHNINVRRRTENQLRKLSRAVEQSPNSIIFAKLRAGIEYINESFVSTTGYRRDEIIGQNPQLLKSGEKRAASTGLSRRSVRPMAALHITPP